MTNAKVKFEPVQVPGKGWNVRALDPASGTYLYLVSGAPYTLAQAQIAADSLARDARNHGMQHVLDCMLPATLGE